VRNTRSSAVSDPKFRSAGGWALGVRLRGKSETCDFQTAAGRIHQQKCACVLSIIGMEYGKPGKYTDARMRGDGPNVLNQRFEDDLCLTRQHLRGTGKRRVLRRSTGAL